MLEKLVLKIARILPATVICVSLFLLPTTSAHAGYACKVYGLIGQAIGKTGAQAKKRAKKDWKNKVNNHFSSEWANWKNAQKKWTLCQNHQNGKRCMRSGVPCVKI